MTRVCKYFASILKRLYDPFSNISIFLSGLAAEVRICKWLCEETKGVYDVILDESHLSDLLQARIRPPPATQQVESSLIRMGFPQVGEM